MNKVGVLSIIEADLPDRPIFNLKKLLDGNYQVEKLGVSYRGNLKAANINPVYLIMANEQNLWTRYKDKMTFYDRDKFGILISRLNEKSLVRKRNHI